MPRDIGDCFLQHTVKRGLHGWLEPAVVERELQVELKVQPLAPSLDEMADCSFQAEIVERSWSNFPSQAVHLGADAVGEPFQSLELIAYLFAGRETMTKLIKAELQKR